MEDCGIQSYSHLYVYDDMWEQLGNRRPIQTVSGVLVLTIGSQEFLAIVCVRFVKIGSQLHSLQIQIYLARLYIALPSIMAQYTFSSYLLLHSTTSDAKSAESGHTRSQEVQLTQIIIYYEKKPRLQEVRKTEANVSRTLEQSIIHTSFTYSYLENAISNLTIPCFQHISEVCISQHDIKHTCTHTHMHTHTHTHTHTWLATYVQTFTHRTTTIYS